MLNEVEDNSICKGGTKIKKNFGGRLGKARQEKNFGGKKVENAHEAKI